MSEADKFNMFSDDEQAVLASLTSLAGSLNPDEAFIDKTETLLNKSFAARRAQPVRHFSLFWKYSAGMAAVALLVFAVVWLVRSVAPGSPISPASAATPFACPVTAGNGSQPPGETTVLPEFLGNGTLWTALWQDGKIIMGFSNRESDGSYSMKWPWWRGVSGAFSISGRRLDASAEPLRSHIPSGYGESGLQITALIFPTTGCWEVTGHLGNSSLTFVTEVVLEDGMPTAQPVDTANPIPSLTANPTPAPTLSSALPIYQARGTTIHLQAGFPAAPEDAGLYTYSPETPVTPEIALEIARRFNIQGQIYKIAGDTHSASALLVTDGNQRLYVYSAQKFFYSAGYDLIPSGEPVLLENAAPVIASFLQARGFDFEYQLRAALGMGTGWFYVIPLSLEGKPAQFDYGIPQGLNLQVSPQGKVLALDAYLLNFDAQPVGKFGLIGAEQAWNRYLDPGADLGFKSTFRGGSASPLVWARVYRSGEPVTIHGRINLIPALENDQAPFITLDLYTLSGKTEGMQNANRDVLVEARGQFVEAGGIRKFQVEDWKPLAQYGASFFQDLLQGSLRQDGDRFIFTSNSIDYVLADVPADAVAAKKDVIVMGYLMGTEFEWQTITLFGDQAFGGGGGGGGGGNFARLNLSGTPVPWPTPQSPQDSQSGAPAIGKSFTGTQGLFIVKINEKLDGSRRTEYGFIADQTYYVLQGTGLDTLEKYHGRPLTIWGAVSGYNQNQTPIVSVEQFEVPYPDLNFQIVRGTQKRTTLDGQSAILFTTENNQTYVALTPIGTLIDALVGYEGDLVDFEVLIIPGETFAGRSAMRVEGGSIATAGQPPSTEITADKPNILTESAPENIEQPTLTIETIELVYFTSDPRYAASYPQAMSPYLQPVWRFYGHYSDGQEAEILIQALQQDYLLPEAAESVQGG